MHQSPIQHSMASFEHITSQKLTAPVTICILGAPICKFTTYRALPHGEKPTTDAAYYSYYNRVYIIIYIFSFNSHAATHLRLLDVPIFDCYPYQLFTIRHDMSQALALQAAEAHLSHSTTTRMEMSTNKVTV